LLAGKIKDKIGLLVLAVAGSFVFISLLGSYITTFDAFTVELGIRIFDRGYTAVEIPPIGVIRAKTHVLPLLFSVRLKNIDLSKIEEVLQHTGDETYLNKLRETAYEEIRIFLTRLLSLAFVGGFAGPFFFSERNIRRLLAAGLTGMLLFGLIVAASLATYRVEAFLYPEFEGIISAAPWMFGLVEETLFHMTSLGEQLQLLAENMGNLYKQVEMLEPLGSVEGELKVVHVSDLHNNPAGMSFIRQVIDTFNVQLVIDTGDITDFGTELEASLAAPIEEFGVPYVFVPGNHDSPRALQRLQQIDQVIILEEGQIEVMGLRIAGIADPASKESGMVVAADYILDDCAARLEQLIAAQDQAPHIIDAHHPRIAARFVGQIPLILAGHTHRFTIQEEEGSVLINPGTTGAAGIRGLQTGQETPYSMVLLHFFFSNDEPFLKAADIIHVYQMESGFSLERRLFGSAAENGSENE
jgi:predicted phosphodiesterase